MKKNIWQDNFRPRYKRGIIVMRLAIISPTAESLNIKSLLDLLAKKDTNKIVENYKIANLNIIIYKRMQICHFLLSP